MSKLDIIRPVDVTSNPQWSLRTYLHPNVVSKWVEYPLDRYSISNEAFLHGIYFMLDLGGVTNIKRAQTYEIVDYFSHPFSIIGKMGHGIEHVEYGKALGEKYTYPDEADIPIGPKTGQHLSLITERHRIVERWQVSVSWTIEDCINHFHHSNTWKQHLNMYEINMNAPIDDIKYLYIKAYLLADPSFTSYDKDFARIFGRTWDNPNAAVPLNLKSDFSHIENSKLARKYAKEVAKGIIERMSLSMQVWANVYHWCPSYYSYDYNYEEMRKTDIYENYDEEVNTSSRPSRPADRAKKQMQRLYTDSHSDIAMKPSNNKTLALMNLSRTDCIRGLILTIVHLCTIATKEKSILLWGRFNKQQLSSTTKAEWEKVKQGLMRGLGLDGQTIGEIKREGDKIYASPEQAYTSNITSEDGFEVQTTKERLVVIMNPEDYAEARVGVAMSRKDYTDPRVRSLQDILDVAGAVFPYRGMKPGFFRIMDRNCLNYIPCFEMDDFIGPGQHLVNRRLRHAHWSESIFGNYVCTLGVPSPHFKASAHFYEEFGLIGQEIEVPETSIPGGVPGG